MTRLHRLETPVQPALSTSEAARRLGLSKSTLLRAVHRGEIQPAYVTPGRHLRFTVANIEELERRLRASPERAA